VDAAQVNDFAGGDLWAAGGQCQSQVDHVGVGAVALDQRRLAVLPAALRKGVGRGITLNPGERASAPVDSVFARVLFVSVSMIAIAVA
jgi:hypothetical protein